MAKKGEKQAGQITSAERGTLETMFFRINGTGIFSLFSLKMFF